MSGKLFKKHKDWIELKFSSLLIFDTILDVPVFIILFLLIKFKLLMPNILMSLPTLSIMERKTVASSSFNSTCYHWAQYSLENPKATTLELFWVSHGKSKHTPRLLNHSLCLPRLPSFSPNIYSIFVSPACFDSECRALCCFLRKDNQFHSRPFCPLAYGWLPKCPFIFFFPIPSLWMSSSLFEITIRLINILYFDVLKGVSTQRLTGGVLCNNVPAIYISIGEMAIAQQSSA